MGGEQSLEQNGLEACRLLHLDVIALHDMPAMRRATVIDAAFRRYAAALHPDRGGDQARFQEFAAARDDLKEWLGCQTPQALEESFSYVSRTDASALIEAMLKEDESARDSGEASGSTTGASTEGKDSGSDGGGVEKDTEKDAEKDAEKDPEKDAERNTEKDTEMDAEKDTEKDAEKDAEKDPEIKEDEVGGEVDGSEGEGAETYHDRVRRIMKERNISYRQAQKVDKEVRKPKAQSKELKVSVLMRTVLDGHDIPLETSKELVNAEAHLIAQKLHQAKNVKKVNRETVKTYETWQVLFLEKKTKYLRETGKHIEADVAGETSAKRAKYQYHRQKADYHARQADMEFEGLAGTAARAAETAQAFA